jgi:hypothetical protein
VRRIVLPLGLVSVSNCHALTAAISALCVILDLLLALPSDSLSEGP